ncbi:hypothetical protein F444_23128, partial [Phytophthora nicotianae P1976]
RIRMDRFARAQGEEKWAADLKRYLRGDVQDLTTSDAKCCAKIAEDYKIDEAGLLFYSLHPNDLMKIATS